MYYDVVLLHPPAVYDFRKKPLFPGALGATPQQVQLIKVPIGMLSIAEYLDRHGYKVIIDNLADRMVSDPEFNVEEHLKNISARVYGIGLHFHHHAQGAMEIARLCKQLHPDSLVITGGLTATRFHEEIISKYRFIDAVIRGEAEKPLLEFIRALEKRDKITSTPNLTYRNEAGEVKYTPLMRPDKDLDGYDFTRIDLLEPKHSIFNSEIEPRGSLEVCRGCIYNCSICGGSAYSYRKLLGREKPAFRSPKRIAEDIKKLRDQDMKVIGLYQDPRMGGEAYWKELMEEIRKGRPDIDRLTFDIFGPVNEEFAREVATLGQQVVFYLCPDSGNERVRTSHGRHYSNEELIKTLKLCYRYHIPVTCFFSIGLAGETPDTVNDTFSLCDELFRLEKTAIDRGQFGTGIPLGGPIISYVFLDPGSLAFDFPGRYGYRVLFQNLEEYIEARSKLSWHQWLNYETDLLGRDALVGLILKSIDYSTDRRERYGAFNEAESASRRLLLEAIRFATDEVERIGNIDRTEERETRLLSLRDATESILSSRPDGRDVFGYKQRILGKNIM